MSGTDSDSTKKVTKGRRRLTVVCTNCRKRKTKCDREQPCGRCRSLGDAATCVYVSDILNSNDTQTKKIETNSFNNTLSNTSPVNVQTAYPIPQQNMTSSNMVDFRLGKTPNFTGKIYSPGSTGWTPASIVSPEDMEFSIPKRCTSDTTIKCDPRQIYGHIPPEIRSKHFINMIPNGHLVEIKRSSITKFAIWTCASIEYRDPYLTVLAAFRKRAVNGTVHHMKKAMSLKNLPNSFSLFTTFDNVDRESNDPNSIDHSDIFRKFAHYREKITLKHLPKNHILDPMDIPSKFVTMRYVFNFYRVHLMNIIPIFNYDTLVAETERLYDTIEQNGEISTKNNDHLVYCIVLLLTKISRISITFSNIPNDNVSPIVRIDTTRYIPIVSYYLFDAKTTKKCTLLKLQCLLLYRLYNWIAPDDGDGQQAQQNSILMGMIIASAREIGIDWSVFSNDIFHFYKISEGARPDANIMKPNDYHILYQKIWSYIVYWDRKMLLINGQECQIEKALEINYLHVNQKFDKTDGSDFYFYLLHLDPILRRIYEEISSFPNKVDIVSLSKHLDTLENEYNNIKKMFAASDIMETNDDPRVFEYDWMIAIAKLCKFHAELISYERECDFVRFHHTFQKFWDHLLRLCVNCFEYWNQRGDMFLGSLSGFYSNRIVELASNKIVHFIKSVILRVHRFPNIDTEAKQELVKFLYLFCSFYVSHFGKEYYRCFKNLFNMKVDFKILSSVGRKDPWGTMLTFILHEMMYNNDDGFQDSVRERLPLISALYDQLSSVPLTFRNEEVVLDVWKRNIFPICRYDEHYNLDLNLPELENINNKYSNKLQSNLFESFYKDSLKYLVNEVNGVSTMEKDTNANMTSEELVQNWEKLDYEKWGNRESNQGNTPPSDELRYNYELIQDIFEPKDFIPFL
ncbi:Oleate activated transcription factor 3 [Nakaseomyces bracarensis]|uniref:Oleate activated transcription factor 3 n=1 Tax=Nakaseomyces bracarensis TaxID=273131 RepID=A0ABR4NM81_9SACH